MLIRGTRMPRVRGHVGQGWKTPFKYLQGGKGRHIHPYLDFDYVIIRG